MVWPQRAYRSCALATTAVVACLACVAHAQAISFGPIGSQPTVGGIQHITGGTRIAINAAPWQVRLKIGSSGICGGSIVNDRQIITAAHCTYNGLSPVSAGSITVVSGSSSFNPDSPSMAPNGASPPDDAVVSSVASIRRHPAYVASSDGRTDARQGRGDVAILTLNAPLPLDGVVRQAIALPQRNSDLPPDAAPSVTGFGLQSDSGDVLDGKLYRLSNLRLLDAVSRTGEWNAYYITATSDIGLDCSGDSGGPLVTGSGASAVLVGLVAFSPDCKAGTTSVYTKVSPGEVYDFIAGNDNPPLAPTGGRDILLTADQGGALPLRPGRVLNCFPGTWTNGPAITVTFFDSAGAILQEGASRRYTVTGSDVGKRIACRAVARNEGGVGRTPETSAPPAVENLAPAALGSRKSAKLSVSLRARTGEAFRGESVGLTIRLYSRGSTAAVNAQACVTVPKGWRVVRRGGAKVFGQSVCLRKRSLRQYELLYTTISIRPGSRAKTGRTKIKVRAAADNASAAFSSRTFRVF